MLRIELVNPSHEPANHGRPMGNDVVTTADQELQLHSLPFVSRHRRFWFTGRRPAALAESAVRFPGRPPTR